MEALFEMRDSYSDFLNLSQVPPAARREVAVETFLLLWEIIARLELPVLDEIPDAPADTDGEGGEQAEELTHWQIPGTEITIARVAEGPRAGAFLFSPDTVERARRFYKKVRELPYLRSMPVKDPLKAGRFLTGWMIPPAWVEALPDWANTSIVDQLLWKWFALLLLFGIALGVVAAVVRWSRRGPWNGSLRSYLRRLSAPLLILGLTPLVQYLAAYPSTVSLPVPGSAALPSLWRPDHTRKFHGDPQPLCGPSDPGR